MKRGDFIIILDGFDEVLRDKAENIQKQIIAFVENYATTKVIVTSRPDHRFSSWPSFEVVTVAPLLKEDVIELVDKAEFSEDSKKLFLSRLQKTDLFERHNSFLTNPLLASMMLLTFSHNFDIPDRMHLFYQQAFDALYQRHDSYKLGGFKRQFRTTVTEDVFKRIISYFCLITYYEEEFTFTRDAAITSINKAITLAGAAGANPSDLLDDLVQCVCFLILDGLQYTFSHRSFQEYFVAYCMAYVDSRRYEQLIAKFSRRTNDQVVVLLSDMNPEVFRRLYIIPTFKRYAKESQINRKIRSVPTFYKDAALNFTIRVMRSPAKSTDKKDRSPPRSSIVTLNEGNEFWAFVLLVTRLYGRNVKIDAAQTRHRHEERQRKDDEAVHAIFGALKLSPSNIVEVIVSGTAFSYLIKEDSPQKQQSIRDESVTTKNNVAVEHFKQSFMHEYLEFCLDTLQKYYAEQHRLEDTSNNALNDLFG
jgi:hypothetical protein